MKISKKFTGNLLMTLISVTMSGCAFPPYSVDDISAHQSHSSSQRLPVRNWTPTEVVLECVGDKMREQHIVPPLIAWGVFDSTGKTGVDQAMLVRSAFAKVARRGSGLRTTSMGVAYSNGQPTPEERMRAIDQNRLLALHTPDWVIEGGVRSITNNAKSEQRSGGFSTNQATGGRSSTRSFDEIRLSYHLKHFRNGVDIPGASVDLKVVHQSSSTATDLGAYIATRLNNRERGIGLQFGHSVESAESADDAIQVAVETAVAMLLADRFNIDLAECPTQSTPLNATENRKIYDGLNEAGRMRWVLERLQSLGYYRGTLNSKSGDKTREAIMHFERDNGIPHNGGVITYALFAALGQVRPKDENSLQIVLSQPYIPYKLNDPLRAQVVIPKAGWVYCFYQSPIELMNIFPLIKSRRNYVNSRSPLSLPADGEGRPHPTLTLSETGVHSIYCAETSKDISKKMPKSLLPQENAKGWMIETLASEIKRIAGNDWIADSHKKFTVVDKKQ